MIAQNSRKVNFTFSSRPIGNLSVRKAINRSFSNGIFAYMTIEKSRNAFRAQNHALCALFDTGAIFCDIIVQKSGKEIKSMRIAIVDDNIRDAGKIEFALMDIAKDILIDKYESGSAFIEKIKGGVFYDIVFMDVYLGDENGTDIVRSMQEITPSTQVIFSTTSKDHAIEAFRLNAVGYLLKPYEEADVVKVFARAGLRRESSEETVLLQFGTENRLFRVADVVKIESDKHYTKITVSSGNVSRYHYGYSEVAVKFVKGFIEIKRGVSVNMAYIERIRNGVVYLRDGSNYKIARGKKDYVVSQFTAFAINKSSIF